MSKTDLEVAARDVAELVGQPFCYHRPESNRLQAIALMVALYLVVLVTLLVLASGVTVLLAGGLVLPVVLLLRLVLRRRRSGCRVEVRPEGLIVRTCQRTQELAWDQVHSIEFRKDLDGAFHDVLLGDVTVELDLSTAEGLRLSRLVEAIVVRRLHAERLPSEPPVSAAAISLHHDAPEPDARGLSPADTPDSEG